MPGAAPRGEVLASTQLALRPCWAGHFRPSSRRGCTGAAVLAALSDQARLLCCAHSAGVTLFASPKLD